MRLLALVVLVLCGALPACGSDVATCASICGSSGTSPFGQNQQGSNGSAPISAAACATSCTAQEDACESKGQGATFQEYLTCVGNAGGLGAGVQQSVQTTNANQPAQYTAASPTVTACATEYVAIVSACGAEGQSEPLDAGNSADVIVVVVLPDASATGGLNEPCNSDGTCDPGLACGVETTTTDPSQPPTYQTECGQ
jgi:hypothetical protein